MGLGGCASFEGKKNENNNVTEAPVAVNYTDEAGSVHVRATVKGDTAASEAAPIKTSSEASSETSSEASSDVPTKASTGASKEKETRQISSIEYAKLMGCGFNLGNEFDANDCTWLSDEMEYESAWSNAKTDREFIKHLKSLGFTSIRIPVSWHDHVDSSYNISKQWLDRVEEVVSWAYDEGFYVVINIHHDVDRKYIYPTNDCYESSRKYMVAIWTQLAERFAPYGDRLVFESINEPRLKGETYEWWVKGDDSRCREAFGVLNRLNQDFVDCVRSVPGNENRFLMVPSYCDMYETASLGFVMPKDSADDKILFTFHSYLPFKFTQENNGYSEFGKAEKDANVEAFRSIDELFLKKNVGVVLGEYGAVDKGNDSTRLAYYIYISTFSKELGLSYMVWDNNAFSGEYTFGLIDREKIVDKEKAIIDAIVN